MTTKKKHTAELMTLAAAIPSLIGELQNQITDVVTAMESLEKSGLIYATEHWRKDGKGEPKYLYLLFPQKNGDTRRRDYVGCDPEGIAEARAGISRAQEYDKLASNYSALVCRARHVKEAMQDACRHLNH